MRLTISSSVISALFILLAFTASAQETPGTSYSIQCPNLTLTLQIGSRDATTGGQVTQLQRFLSDYYDLDPNEYVTGYFGRLTRENVRRFQCQHMGICTGSEETNGYGVVGPRTRNAIMQACIAVLSSNTTNTTTNTAQYNQASYYTESSYHSQDTNPPTIYNQAAYYDQGTYYTQASYTPTTTNAYAQGTYYTQGTYYSEAGYYSQGSYVPANAPTISVTTIPMAYSGTYYGATFLVTITFATTPAVIDQGGSNVPLQRSIALAGNYRVDFGSSPSASVTSFMQKCTRNEPLAPSQNWDYYTYTCTNEFNGAVFSSGSHGGNTYTARLYKDGTEIASQTYTVSN